MASSLKNKFEDLAKPEEKPVIKAKKIQKAATWSDRNVTSSAGGKQVKTAEGKKVVQYENLPPKKSLTDLP